MKLFVMFKQAGICNRHTPPAPKHDSSVQGHPHLSKAKTKKLHVIFFFFVCKFVRLERDALAAILVACDGELKKFPNKHSGYN